MMKHIKQNGYLKRIYRLATGSLIFPPLVVFIAILVITIWPWQNSSRSLSQDINRSMDNQAKEVEDRLEATFMTVNNVLQSGAGLLEVSPDLTRAQWDSFFAATGLTSDRTGIQAVSYIKVFDQSELQNVTDFMISQGVSDFSVKPAEPVRQRYSAVMQLYPETDATNGVVGLDMLTIPARRATMDRAAETGQSVLTEKVKLIQNVPTSDQYGFILYTPIYKPGADLSKPEFRSQNISGYVAGGFRAKRFFGNIVGQPSTARNYGVKIYDTTIKEESLLYQTENSGAIASEKNTRTITRPMSISDRTWQFVFTFNTDRVASASERSAPTYILLVGITTACLVFLALYSIFKSRARELQQQKDIEVNLAKDELLSLASHQMRTPATGVKQYLGMVLQGFAGEIDEAQQALLTKAYTSNERQLHVINQILHLAKLESGRIVLAKHETNVTELVNDITEEQQDELTAKGHVLKLILPKKTVVAFVDSHMIRMAVENILSNAIKYTIESGVIKVKLSQTPSAVVITIKDSGVGIDSMKYEEIFKQFTRLYDEKTERISGTGVGLYLADQLIKLHKGSLTVTSEVDAGSEFTVTLPKGKQPKK